MSKAVFGAGCFWGVEKKFSELKGVTKTEVGYSQGINEKTSFEEVCQGLIKRFSYRPSLDFDGDTVDRELVCEMVFEIREQKECA